MKAELAVELLKRVYCEILRDELHKLALSTNSKVDDTVLAVLDAILQCPETE